MSFVIKDKYGRQFRKLRISLTNQCNFSCNYCVEPGTNGNGISNALNSSKSLTAEEIFTIVKKIHEINPIEEIKLTGGEPFLFNQLFELISKLNALSAKRISITTNGQFLKPHANRLYENGVKDINVSLDAVDPELFKKITKKDLYTQVIAGIDAALVAGISVKLNSVIMRNINHHQLVPLLNFAQSRNIRIRFLELMKMGYLYKGNRDFLFTEEEMLREISKHFDIKKLERKNHATAHYWVTDTGIKFGIIANESSPFCADCDRLRLNSKGEIFGCICSISGIDLLSTLNDNKATVNKIRLALGQKQSAKFLGSPISMKMIGG